ETISRGVGAHAGHGHTVREHGAHLSDQRIRQLAAAANVDKGRWSTFELQQECIRAVLTAVNDPTNTGPLSPINANGVQVITANNTFNTVTKPGNPHLAGHADRHPDSRAEVLGAKALHQAYLKSKVEAKDQNAGKVVGQSFPSNGGPAQDCSRYDVILEQD